MQIIPSSLSDVGQKREHNEDAFLCDLDAGLFIVCDGMGGHAAGEVASALALETTAKLVRGKLEELRRLATGEREDRKRILQTLQMAVEEANATVHGRAEDEPSHRGMGTTLSLMLVVDQRAFIAHVGDSRVYLIRQEHVHQVTSDHTILSEMLRAGRVKAEEASTVKHMNALTRAVGVYATTDVDTIEVDVLPDDRFIICSDGLHQYLDGFDVKTFLNHVEPETASEELIAFANKRGGSDNITAITLFVQDLVSSRETERIRLTIKTLREIPLFHFLSFSELLRVITICHLREVEAGVELITENEPGEDLYILVEGAARVHREGETVADIGPGRHVGEMALIDNRPRSASVTTTNQCLLIHIGRDDFYALLREDPVTAVKILWNFIQSLTSTIRTLNAEVLLAQRGDTQVNMPAVDHPYDSKLD